MSARRNARAWPALLALLALLLALAGGSRPLSAATPAYAQMARGASASVSKVSLVREAFSAIYNHYFDPVNAADLLDAAWRGAAGAAATAGNRTPPATPDLSGGAAQAYARFAAAYAALEVATPIDPTELAYAAIRGMTAYIGNCHTYFLTPAQAAAQRAAEDGEEQTGLGFRRSFTPPPWLVTYVVPGGPADTAGLRAGDTILAYDGDSSPSAPTQRAARVEGEAVTLTVRRPGDVTPYQLAVAIGRYRVPHLESRIVESGAGRIGYLRFFTWERGGAQAEAIRDAIAAFEPQGVVGWVIDVRANGGGYAGPIADLFAPAGPLFRQVARNGGSFVVSADGEGVTPPRPLAFLIGPGSGSASEIVPEALREEGAAVLVGEHTGGCMAGTTEVPLSDGASMWVTSVHILIGGSEQDLEGIGVEPDIVAPLTAEDLAAGRDPGLDAAVRAVQRAAAEHVPLVELAPALSGVR